MNVINRRFTTVKGNSVAVFVAKQVHQVNGFVALGRTTRTWAVVNDKHVVDVPFSAKADSAVAAAGF